MFNHSLARRLFLINLLFLVIPTFIVLGFFFNKSRIEHKLDNLYHMRDLAYSRDIYIEEHLTFCKNILSILTSSLHLDTPDKIDHEALPLSFKQILGTVPSFDNIIYTQKNDKGQFLVSTSTNYAIDQDLTKYRFITSALKEGSSMTLGVGPQGNPSLFITKLIKASDDTVLGTLTITQDPNNLLSKILDTTYFILGTSFSLFNDVGIYFAGDDSSLIMSTFKPITPEQLAELKTEGVVASTSITYHTSNQVNIPPFKDVFEIETPSGKDLILKWPIPNSNAHLVVSIEENILLTPFYEHIIKSVFIILLITIIASLLIWFLAKVLAEPLGQFLNVMQEVSKGNLDVRFINNEVGYEINALGETTNRMLSNLKVLLETIRTEPLKQKVAGEELKIGHQIQQRILPQRGGLFEV